MPTSFFTLTVPPPAVTGSMPAEPRRQYRLRSVNHGTGGEANKVKVAKRHAALFYRGNSLSGFAR